MPATIVSLGYHETDRELALAAAIDPTDLLGSIKPGHSVYLRVNSNSGDPYPYSTSPDLIISVGNRLRARGVTDIRIGDRSFWGDEHTEANLQRNGVQDAAQALGTTAVVFDNHVAWVELDESTLPTWQPPVRIPELVQTATHVINLACVKTHFIGHITMCLKLCLGLVHADDRKRVGNLDVHVSARLWRQVAEVARHARNHINILDGYEAVTSGGPTVNDVPNGAPNNWRPQTVRPRTIIATTDPIAADIVGAALLRLYSPSFEAVKQIHPFALPQITTAMQWGGIGFSDPAELSLISATFPELQKLREDLFGVP